MRGMVNKIVVFALMSLAASTNAQPVDIDTIDQSEIIPYLNSETIIPALKVVTGNHIVQVDSQGKNRVTAVATNGLQFEIDFHGCDDNIPPRCKAMSLLSIWEKPKSSKEIKKLLPGFLIDNSIANAGILMDGRPYLTRYVIADFGTPQGNILSEIANFVRVATQFNSLLTKPGK
jgi:hypothetical protein